MVTVSDDGKGIDEDVIQFRPESVGVGIGGMRQRVTELGGTLRLVNANPGTVVEVVIPVGQAAPVRARFRFRHRSRQPKPTDLCCFALIVLPIFSLIVRARYFVFVCLDLDFFVLDIKTKAVVDAHVLVGNPDQRKE